MTKLKNTYKLLFEWEKTNIPLKTVHLVGYFI